MLYRIMTIVAFAIALAAGPTAALGDEVAYISHEKVAAATGVIAKGSDHIVSISRRDKGGQAEVHAGETDVFYVVEGSATFVTGGTVTNSKTTGPGQIRGSGISGGTSRTLSKGDVVVIPKGTPHWFKEVPEKVVYFVVKSI